MRHRLLESFVRNKKQRSAELFSGFTISLRPIFRITIEHNSEVPAIMIEYISDIARNYYPY